jgi:hypothetical protein
MPGDQRLFAYVVVRDGAFLSEEECRRRLAESLPDYMIPARVVFLGRLPLTPNGKIDRNALPAPVGQPGDGVIDHGTGARSCDHIEGIISRIWGDVLGVERVGLDENIFDLGATSLMMPQVQLELERGLARQISLVDLFEFHTVRSLAAHLSGAATVPQTSNRGQRRRAARHHVGFR